MLCNIDASAKPRVPAASRLPGRARKVRVHHDGKAGPVDAKTKEPT
jgi:hypothetical protein